MQTPHLNALRAVEATLRLGTMARAADELGVTPAAVGQQVRLLEDYLQCPLFDRHPGGVVPTEAAERVAPALSEGFAGLAGALAELAALDDPDRVWVTMTEALAEHWLPVRLPSFLSRHPGIDLRLDGTPALRTLGAGAFDFAIRSMPRPDDETDCAALYPNSVTPLCHPDFARRYNLGPDTDTLVDVPLCGIDTPGTDPMRIGWAEWCETRGMDWSPGTVTSGVIQTGGALRMARAGLALALGSPHISRAALADGSLIMPFGPGSVTNEHYWYVLLWPPGRRLRGTQRAFRDWIVAAAEEDRAALGV